MPKKGSDTKPVITAPRWEEVQGKTLIEHFCNPDKLLLCPYDPHHLIRACRFPYHLIKCRKNHPELVGELWTCPFNARHLMRKHELSHHISTCVDRLASDKTDSKFQIPVSTWTAPVENPSTSSNVIAGLRAPRVLPWMSSSTDF
uniref:Gametocyte-specific factor 1-like n=1 Tax=Sinocyclocheilus grahami TaxID=75366 RepID=A0A672K982_SINGR